jgi:hypothetical protein
MIVLSQLLLAFYALGCLSFGALMMRVIARKVWNLEDESALTVITIYFLLGVGILGSIWVVVALLGWLSPWLVGAVCVLSTALSWRVLSALVKRFYQETRSWLSKLKSAPWPWKLLVIAVSVLVILLGIASMLPPSSDAAAFYMPIAKVTGASHRLLPLRGEFEGFSRIGLLGELHYAALIGLGSMTAAKQFTWLAGLAPAVMVAAVGSKVGLGRKGRWIAAIVVLTSTAVTFIIVSGKVDLYAAALGSAAFFWALQWKRYPEKHPLRLAGIFTGVSVIAKLPYAAALAPAILALVLWRLASSQVKDRPEDRPVWLPYASTVLLLGLWMAPMAIPHVLKNGLLFGEPLAPFIVAPGHYTLLQSWFSPEVTRTLILTYPFALVLGYNPMQAGHLSVLMLAFLPLAFLLRKPRRFLESPLVQLTLCSTIGVVVWLLINPSILAPRFLMATLFMFVPVLAKGAESMLQESKRTRLLAGGVYVSLFAALAFSLMTTGVYAYQAIQYVSGAHDACEYERANCRAMSVLSENAAVGDRIFLAEAHAIWLRADLLQCVSERAELGTFLDAPSAEERWQYLFDRGFEYVAVNPRSYSAYAEALDVSQAPDWIEVVELFHEDGYSVYQIVSADASRQPSVACRQIDPPAWGIAPYPLEYE